MEIKINKIIIIFLSIKYIIKSIEININSENVNYNEYFVSGKENYT